MSPTGAIHRRCFLQLSGLAAAVVPSWAASASQPSPVSTPAASDVVAVVTDMVQQRSIPDACVLVHQSDEEPWTAGFGVSDLESKAPMTPDLHVRIGSITKTMTATIVLQLVDEGTVSLDETLATALPDQADFPNADIITIRHLLNMQSGISSDTEEEAFLMAIAADPTQAWTPEALIGIVRDKEPLFAPGEDFHYSNTNYNILGHLIEEETGIPLTESFQQRIFEPPGMSQTSLPDTVELPLPFSRGYGTDFERPDSTPVPSVSGPGGEPLRDWTEFHPSIAWAAGGAVSTLGDLHVWLREIREGSLLSSVLQQERLSIVPVETGSNDQELGYGLGVGNYDGLIGHDGSVFGFGAFAGYSPEAGASIITAINVNPSPENASAAELAFAIRDALGASVATPDVK